MNSLSGSNVHYFYFPIEYCLQNLESSGFHEMELYLGTPHVFIDRNTVDEFADIFFLAKIHHIQISSVHPETLSFRYTLCHPDPIWNKRSVLAYKRCIDYAADNGVPSLHTDISGAFRDLPHTEIFEQVYKNLCELAVYAKDKKIALSMESTAREYQGFLSDLPSMAKLLDALDKYYSDVFYIGLNWEAVHAMKEDPNDWLHMFGERIQYIRFENPESLKLIIPWCKESHYCGTLQFYPLEDDTLLSPYIADRQVREMAGKAKKNGIDQQKTDCRHELPLL